MDYSVIIRKAPDGFYIASCPLIPEAMAQGQTYDECLANIKEVMALCLEYRKELGEEIPDEAGANKVTVSIWQDYLLTAEGQSRHIPPPRLSPCACPYSSCPDN